MNPRYLLLLPAVLLSTYLFGQGLVTLRNAQGEVVNGTVVQASALQSTDTVKLRTALNGSAALSVNVRRYEMWSVPGTENFYCWGVCYLPVAAGVNATWVSQHWVDMVPGQVYNDFAAYHVANGLSGSTARYRFVFFDMADPQGADSSWVDIQFGGAVGVAERPEALIRTALFPNPSQGQDVWFEHALDRWKPGTELVLYTVLGERIRRVPLQGAEGRTLIRTADLGAGVYFANVERGGRVLGTRRLVVTH